MGRGERGNNTGRNAEIKIKKEENREEKDVRDD